MSNPNSSYFPLSLGSIWAFGSQLQTISDTATIQGKLCYGLSLWPDNPPDYWFRNSGDSVFIYDVPRINDTANGLLFNFGANIGDTLTLPRRLECSFGSKIILVNKNETVTTPAGIFKNCAHFVHRSSCSDSGILESWYARGGGRIKYTANNYSGIQIYVLTAFSL